MKFKILSHACLLIETEQTSIVIDPWLLGSCYWRSWWNFPEASFDPAELDDVDAVVISHIHWDHWHGGSLKKYFSGKPVFLPDEPGLRSERDLRAIGFRNITRVAHGRTIQIGDIDLTLYQFGLFLNDAAIVVESRGVRLLNANDAKIAGWALQGILARHGRFDFALRSHSSANPRICFQMEEGGDFVADDREHYFRSFVAFMDRVKPRYAIPFASNHCHLHEDVFALNSFISNPLQLREFVEKAPGKRDWQLQVMLPGSQWSQQEGFALRSEECFANLDSELLAYRQRVDNTLDEYRRYENRVNISDTLFAKFQKLLEPGLLPNAAKGPLLVSVRRPDGHGRTMRYEVGRSTYEEVPFTTHSDPGVPLMLFPADVFRDSVLKNMFHHAGISKRCRFLGRTRHDMKRLQAVMSVLEKVELGFLPLSAGYLRRFAKAYVRRWREIFVYAQGFWLIKIRRKPIYLAEEAILRGEL